MKSAIGYCRVSTAGQAGDDKFGLEAQQEQIKLYALANGYMIAGWAIDSGFSGATLERPALRELIYGDVSNPPIEAVIIAKSDRISRNMEQYFYVKYVLKRKNIILKSVSEDFGEMGVFAGVMESLILFMAEQERINITTRTKGGRRLKAANGGYSGGRTPYGYKAEKGSYIVVPDEAEMIQQIFKFIDEQKTLKFIADWLNESEYKTRSGKKFYLSHIKAIKENRQTYEGMYKYGKMGWVKGTHEPILKQKGE